eukprot:scaffold5126_cov190-Amphora_coffeaeformis.AAC.7
MLTWNKFECICPAVDFEAYIKFRQDYVNRKEEEEEEEQYGGLSFDMDWSWHLKIEVDYGEVEDSCLG